MAGGVFAGASMPATDTIVNPGNPVAEIVGSPGARGVGCGVVTARAFSLPDFTCSDTPP
jgi:hypothetical protein